MGTTTTPGERLRTLRRSLKLSGLDLSKTLGMSKGIVSYWESDRSALTQCACLALQAVYGVSATWLQEGKGPMWHPKAAIHAPEPSPKGLVFYPVLPDGSVPFDDQGQLLPPPPGSDVIGLPDGVLHITSSTTRLRPDDANFWIQIDDPFMRDTLGTIALVLVDSSEDGCQAIEDHALYFIRLGAGQDPCVRRLAVDPASGDVLVGTDARDRVPLRLSRSQPDGFRQLGRIRLILRKAGA